MTLAETAAELRRLHTAPELLQVVNVWDVASARVVASMPETRALATASIEQLGVARLSYGPHTQRVALGALQDLASELYGGGVLPRDIRPLN